MSGSPKLVEEDSREMVLIAGGRRCAGSATGLQVVKIDEKLGLEQKPTHPLPILRSDGSTLYSHKRSRAGSPEVR
ncbi:MAG: hypothetical protein M9953_03780 [Thermomicrobiales bacterium]|nr:hypothetical protein [Thermomicrobiales bacterium]